MVTRDHTTHSTDIPHPSAGLKMPAEGVFSIRRHVFVTAMSPPRLYHGWRIRLPDNKRNDEILA